jgi:hypothetical protein
VLILEASPVAMHEFVLRTNCHLMAIAKPRIFTAELAGVSIELRWLAKLGRLRSSGELFVDVTRAIKPREGLPWASFN